VLGKKNFGAEIFGDFSGSRAHARVIHASLEGLLRFHAEKALPLVRLGAASMPQNPVSNENWG